MSATALHSHLILGPGTHGQYLRSFLQQNVSSFSFSEAWPAYRMVRCRSGKVEYTERSRFYEMASWFLYGVNHRLSRFNHGQQRHLSTLFRFYQSLTTSAVQFPAQLIGFSQVTAEPMARNKKAGGLNILEHGLLHADAWMNVARRFANDSRYSVKPGYALLTSGLVRMMRREYELADYIQVHSSFALQSFLNAGIPKEKMILTLLGTDYPTEVPQREVNHGPLRVLFFGRIEILKGVDQLLTAISQIPSGHIQLTLAGRIMPDMKPWLEQYPSAFQYAGVQTRNQLIGLLDQTDLVVFPSHYDAFGLVILESMARGVPVLCSGQSAGPDVITPGVDGLLFSHENQDELRQQIQWCLDHRNELVSMGQRARQTIIDRFTMEAYFERLHQNLNKTGFVF